MDEDEVIVESAENAFEPFVVHFAKVFIVSARMVAYTIRPYGIGGKQKCATLKGYRRFYSM